MAALLSTPPLSPPKQRLRFWLVLCLQNKKEKPSERCLSEILRLRLSSAPPVPPPLVRLLLLALQLPKVPLYAKCVAVVIYADHPQLGAAACPQLCLGTARLGVTVLQENSFSEFHLHIFC